METHVYPKTNDKNAEQRIQRRTKKSRMIVRARLRTAFLLRKKSRPSRARLTAGKDCKLTSRN